MMLEARAREVVLQSCVVAAHQPRQGAAEVATTVELLLFCF